LGVKKKFVHRKIAQPPPPPQISNGPSLSIEAADFRTLKEANEYVKGRFDFPKSEQIYLQRFDQDWNEYIDISQIENVKDKDKLLVVVVKDKKGANQENTIKVFVFFIITFYMYTCNYCTYRDRGDLI
jgi:hypothetical protein